MPFNNELLDDPLATDVCTTFSGGQVSSQRANLIDENQAAELCNVIINSSGELYKRRGARALSDGYVKQPGNRVQALFQFSTSTVDRLVAFCAGSASYLNGSDWTTYFSAEITDHNELVDVVQFTDKLYFTDSSAPNLKVYNGTAVTQVSSAPNPTILSTMSNRLVASGVSDIPDAVYFSDILDGETWDLVNSVIRVGAGDGKRVTAVLPWIQNSLLVWKEGSTHVVQIDPTQDVVNWSISTIHNGIGCVAKHSVAQVGQDVFFLARSGVQSVQRQLATSTNEIPIPISQPIQNLIDSIRWEYAYKATAWFYNNFYLLSVPINSNEPDTTLVYHRLTGGWTIFTGWNASSFYEQPYNGKTRLIIGAADGQCSEWLDYYSPTTEPDDAYNEGLTYLTLPFNLDTQFPGSGEFTAEVLTRAQIFGDALSPKSGFYGEVELVRTTGSVTIAAVCDGKPDVTLAEIAVQLNIFELPLELPISFEPEGWKRTRFNLQQIPQFRELQYRVTCPSGKMVLRNLLSAGFLDTLELRNV